MQHKMDAYKDGYSWILYCKICGDENPTGECVGMFVPHGQRTIKENNSKESVDNRIDNKLKCE